MHRLRFTELAVEALNQLNAPGRPRQSRRNVDEVLDDLEERSAPLGTDAEYWGQGVDGREIFVSEAEAGPPSLCVYWRAGVRRQTIEILDIGP